MMRFFLQMEDIGNVFASDEEALVGGSHVRAGQ